MEVIKGGLGEPDGGLLSAADIFAIDDVEYIDVPMPEWTPKGAEVPRKIRLRTLTHDELMAYTEELKDEKNAKQGNVLIVIRTAVNADGSPMFTRAQAELLSKKSAKAFTRLAREAGILNGVRKADADKAGKE